MNLLPHELAGLRRRCFAFPGVLVGPLDCFFLRHGFSLSMPRFGARELPATVPRGIITDWPAPDGVMDHNARLYFFDWKRVELLGEPWRSSRSLPSG
jgi:hypothetical protein